MSPHRRRLGLSVDPVPRLTSSRNAAISFFARRDLLGEDVGPPSALWNLPEARAIARRQNRDGSWSYPCGGKPHRRGEHYDQLETFRQLALLVGKHGATREHPAAERAAEFLLSFQSDEGDLRGIYGNQYATTYVGAITEVLVNAGYAGDRRVERTFRWLLATRQRDGGWAIPLRTVGIPFSEFVDLTLHPHPIAPDRSRPSSHLVTGMALRAFAAHPRRRRSPEVLRAAGLLATRLYTKDPYGDRGAVAFWDRVSFPFWFTDIVSALDSLSLLGLGPDNAHIEDALARVKALQRGDGMFAFKQLRDSDPDLAEWICLAVCRILSRWSDHRH
ncbi:MAG: hypothetical protein WCB51_06500 [Candidatus Dormiibacterota bacterium]